MQLEEENAALKDALAREKAKNEILLQQVLDAEDEIAGGDVEAFADVIPNEDREFWRGQFLANRVEAVAYLSRMRERGGKAPAPTSAVVAKPIHNRSAAKVQAAAPAAPAAVPAADKACAIRNRAQEIAKRDKCSYTVAWGRAEKEIGG